MTFQHSTENPLFILSDRQKKRILNGGLTESLESEVVNFSGPNISFTF